MTDREDIPEAMRRRMQVRHARYRLLRVTFPLTIAALVAVMFIMGYAEGFGAASRVLHLVAAPGAMHIVDQKVPMAGQAADSAASFRIIEHRGQEVIEGPGFEGAILGACADGPDALVLTTDTRMLRFERKDDAWTRTVVRPLGLNDPEAAPVIADVSGDLWLFWARGPEVLARPAERPEVAPVVIIKASSPGLRIHARGDRGQVWLSILELRTGVLRVINAGPSVNTDTPSAAISIVSRCEPLSNVGRVSLAVVSGRPVVAWTRREDTSREWRISAWSSDSARWGEYAGPPRAVAGQLELTSFVSLASLDTRLIAYFNDGAEVKRVEAVLGDTLSPWGEPEAVPMNRTRGLGAQLAWLAVLFVLGLVAASQGVWLMLNRERPRDRALKELLQRGGTARKDEPRLLFAGGLPRALALIIDLAMTSPVVIMLRGIYDFRWEDAYGFIAFVSFDSMQTGLLQAVSATLITLAILTAYSTFCELMWGRTFGKALMRLRVVDLEGESPAPWRIVVRNLLRIVEMIHWIVIILPLAVMMLSGKQQRLGDILAGTVVVVDLIPDESPDDIDI